MTAAPGCLRPLGRTHAARSRLPKTAMNVPAPHFLLRARANRHDCPGRWCFMLESGDGSHSLKVEDDEPNTHGERLELLALVRGLEAVPQPARVTVVATSPYVNRVLNGGLDEWRASGWQWERHGEMVPVKNADLWRRVDRALHFHSVDCRSGDDRTRCKSAGGWRPQSSSQTQVMPFAGHARRAGAPVAPSPHGPDDEGRQEPRRRPKLLSRNALALGLALRRRIRQTTRRWRIALKRLAEDADYTDRFEWADQLSFDPKGMPSLPNTAR
jgi:ribonuclease HI